VEVHQPLGSRIVRKTNPFLMNCVTCVLAMSASPLMAAPPESSQACWQPAFETGDADAVAQCYAHPTR
jgi:hypothetical protein